MIDLLRQYLIMRPRLAGPESELSPVFLLSRLVLDGPRRAADMATVMCWDPSTVSRAVATLVKAGMLERKSDPDDGRASLLVPTTAGRDRVAEHRRRRGIAIAPVVADWSHQDRATLLRLVRRYIAGINEHRESVIETMTHGHQTGCTGTADDHSDLPATEML